MVKDGGGGGGGEGGECGVSKGGGFDIVVAAGAAEMGMVVFFLRWRRWSKREQ